MASLEAAARQQHGQDQAQRLLGILLAGSEPALAHNRPRAAGAPPARGAERPGGGGPASEDTLLGSLLATATMSCAGAAAGSEGAQLKINKADWAKDFLFMDRDRNVMEVKLPAAPPPPPGASAPLPAGGEASPQGGPGAATAARLLEALAAAAAAARAPDDTDDPDVVVAAETTVHFQRGMELPAGFQVAWHGDLGLHSIAGTEQAIAVRRMKRSAVPGYAQEGVVPAASAEDDRRMALLTPAQAAAEAAPATAGAEKESMHLQLLRAVSEDKAKDLLGRLLAGEEQPAVEAPPASTWPDYAPAAPPGLWEGARASAGELARRWSAQTPAVDPSAYLQAFAARERYHRVYLESFCAAAQSEVAQALSKIQLMRWSSLVRAALRRPSLRLGGGRARPPPHKGRRPTAPAPGPAGSQPAPRRQGAPAHAARRGCAGPAPSGAGARVQKDHRPSAQPAAPKSRAKPAASSAGSPAWNTPLPTGLVTRI